MGDKITLINGKLNVPNQPVIPFIEGDGTGPEIWQAAKNVFEKAVEKAYNGKRKIEWKEVLAGQKAFDKTGSWLPNDTLDVFKEYLIGIKGPLTTPVGGGIRSLNVALRQTLDLFACVRPVNWFNGVPSPVKNPDYVDMTIFRENTEDIYAGIEYQTGTPENTRLKDFLINEMGVSKIRFPETSSIGIKPVSEEGSKRLVRSAINYAIKNNLPSVTLVHKGNIMKFTEGSFKNWGYEVAEQEFSDHTFTWNQYDKILADKGKEAADIAQETALNSGKILIKDSIADAFLQEILLRPKLYSVVATLNLNGDYISDALAAMVGGIGIAPGANINYVSGHAIFEATHGTAPKLAGQNKANPSSVILSGAMMFEYMGWSEVTELIHKAVGKAIESKRVTIDFYELMENATLVGTKEFGEEIIKCMQ